MSPVSTDSMERPKLLGGRVRTRAAVRFLMGLGDDPELSVADVRWLRPWIKAGATEAEARALLKRLGWRES